MKNVLITGISGFAGSFLAENLLHAGEYSISGTYLTESSLENLSGIVDKLTLVQIDLNDSARVEKLIHESKPDSIFHLAALPSASDSYTNPRESVENNIGVELNLLEAVKNNNLPSCKILVVSSAEIYGMVEKNDLPIDEDTLFQPVSPYAVSKIAQDYFGLQYYLAYDMQIVRARPFNHIGPRQTPKFVVASFAKQIAEIEKSSVDNPTIKVGNLDSKRDFTDVHDMVEAYRLLIEQGTVGEAYNIGSGKSYKISEILAMLLSFSHKKISVEADDSLLRPSDVPDIVCDYSKIHGATGWEPKIELHKTLKDTLDYWRDIV